MKIKRWKKEGSPEVVVERYGRSLILQKYEDPKTKSIEEFSYFKGAPFASVVLAITSDGNVLVTRQYRQVVDEILLELPGGSSKHPGQSPEEVALKEVAEETGGFAPEKIISLSLRPLWHDAPCFASTFYPFLFTNCRKTNGRKLCGDKGEYIELVYVPLAKWIEMCLSGQIVEAKSVVVTALALRHLGHSVNKNLP